MRKQNRDGDMKAVRLKDKGIFIEDVPTPVPAEGEALIKVIKAGICRTDLELLKGYMDFEGILGHEFVGLVVESEEKEWLGKRVVGEINLPCGHCEICSALDPKHCPSRQVLGIDRKNGVFAEFVALPVENLHAVPSDLSDIEAVFVEPLAASLAIYDHIQVDPAEEALVLGDGKLGLLVAQVLRRRLDHVFCAGHHPRKLALLQKRGIRTSKDAQEWDRRFGLVIEVTGTSEGIRQALCLVKPKGKIIAKSTFHGMAKMDFSALVVNEIQLIGSRCGSFKEALEFLKMESIELEGMVDEDFALADAERAFSRAKDPEAIKILLSP
jgi:threonine dehydrogenase-like Zn-dependent dehydrogenase